MTERRRFAVIAGEGQSSGLRPNHDLMLVERSTSSEQLTFGAWTQSGERLLSVGIDGIDFQTFREVLVDACVNFIVDTRFLASFRGRGFTRALTEATFHELGVQYERWFDLANEHVGTSANTHVVLKRYAEALRAERSGALSKLTERLQKGTVLLLGRESSHFGSEREVLVDLLVERFGSLKVFALTQASASDWNWTSVLFQEKSRAPRENKQGKSRIRQNINVVVDQLEFPGPESTED